MRPSDVGGTSGCDPALLEELSHLSTPTVVNALKQLGVEPLDLETTDASIVCVSPSLGRSVGFVATAKVWISEHRAYEGGDSGLRRRFLEHILDQPAPRIPVVENVGTPEGRGCFWGEVQATLHRALDCRAGVTNGPVRDVDEMEAVGFQAFARGLATGGAYHHHVDVGVPVTVGGLSVRPGELLHADQHGVVKIPLELASRVTEAARAVERSERSILELCRAPSFTIDDLPGLWNVKH